MKKICHIDDLPEGSRKAFGKFTLFHEQGKLFAVESRCPHMGYPMIKGVIRDGVITCAWHQWDFDIEGGNCYRGGCSDLKIFPVKVDQGEIYVADPEEAKVLEKDKSLLREAMMVSDIYLEAKAIARLEQKGLSRREIADTAISQSYRHAQSAHQSEQAAYEYQAIDDALALSDYLDDKDALILMLQGIRQSGGPSGDRAEVFPLSHDIARERAIFLLGKYALDASPLGIERILLGGHVEDFAEDLLDIATRPFFIHHPEVFVSVTSMLLSPSFHENTDPQIQASVLSWVLENGDVNSNPTIAKP